MNSVPTRDGCQQGSKAQSSHEGHVITSAVSVTKRTFGDLEASHAVPQKPSVPENQGTDADHSLCLKHSEWGDSPRTLLQVYSQFNFNPEALFRSLYWSLEHSQL